MHKEWKILRVFIILLVLCFNSTTFAQQNLTGSKELQYTVTVDLQKLVETVQDLTRNVNALTDNQKELSENIKELTKSVNNVNTRLAVIEERTSDLTRNQGYIITGIVALIVGLIGNFLYGNFKKKTITSKQISLDEASEEETTGESRYEYQAKGETS